MKGSSLVFTFLVILLVLTTLSNPVAIVEGSLVAFWNMSEGSASVTDSVGGYSGTIHGASWTPTALVFNSSGYMWNLGTGATAGVGGLEFDGKSYVEVPDAPAFRSANFSVAFWVSADTSSNFANVMGKEYYVAGQQAGWMIYWGDENPRLMYLTVFSPSHKETSSFGVPVTLGEWTHIVFTLDNRTVAAYKNGKLIGRRVSNGYLPVNEPFRIGKAYGETNYFNGLIEDVLYYNSSLSETDVRNLYKSYASNDQGDTNIELSQVSLIQGQENMITARLRDQLGRVLVGAQISFHLNDLDLGNANTDSRGYAHVVCGPRDSGTYSLTAEFAGNGRFRGSVQTAQMNVSNVFLQQVSFGAIGGCALVIGAVFVRARRKRRRFDEDWGSDEELPKLPYYLLPLKCPSMRSLLLTGNIMQP